MKYLIQFGIAPDFRDLLKYDLNNIPYSYKFGKTTQQAKKQYNGYTQCWPEKIQYIKLLYPVPCIWWSTIVLQKRYWSISLISSETKLHFCPLHITHSRFRTGIAKLYFNVDLFAIDINFFFSSSQLPTEQTALKLGPSQKFILIFF